MAEINIFFMRKTKKTNKIEKMAEFGRKLGKLVSNSKMNITKTRKTKFKKFMIIFAF